MPRNKSKSSLVTILILAVAISLWVYDTYGQSSEGTAETSPLPSKTDSYETFTGCTLAPDRSNDGDSFRVKFPGGKTEIIRLNFVDTPESAFKSYDGGQNNHERIAQQAADLGGITPQQAVEIGKQAKTYTLSLLAEAPFTLYTKWDDPYGDRRYRAFVEITQNGKKRLLHELLVEKGLARIHTKGAPIPDGTSEREHQEHLFKLQRTAKSNQAGAWGL